MENTDKEKAMSLLGEIGELSKALNKKIRELKGIIRFEEFDGFDEEPEIFPVEGDVVLYWHDVDYGIEDMKKLLECGVTVTPADFMEEPERECE